MLNNRQFLLVITAPSGTGKTTIYKSILDKHRNMKFSVSFTTRKKRTDEVDGVDYFFIDRTQFQQKIDRDEFIEWAVVHNELYGTERKQVVSILKQGYICILDLDVQGALNVKKKFPDAVTIFIRPPSLKELERRLKKRGTENKEKIRLRLLNAQKELEYTNYFHYIVVNNTVKNSINKIEEIILTEKKKRG